MVYHQIHLTKKIHPQGSDVVALRINAHKLTASALRWELIAIQEGAAV